MSHLVCAWSAPDYLISLLHPSSSLRTHTSLCLGFTLERNQLRSSWTFFQMLLFEVLLFWKWNQHCLWVAVCFQENPRCSRSLPQTHSLLSLVHFDKRNEPNIPELFVKLNSQPAREMGLSNAQTCQALLCPCQKVSCCSLDWLRSLVVCVSCSWGPWGLRKEKAAFWMEIWGVRGDMIVEESTRD